MAQTLTSPATAPRHSGHLSAGTRPEPEAARVLAPTVPAALGNCANAKKMPNRQTGADSCNGVFRSRRRISRDGGPLEAADCPKRLDLRVRIGLAPALLEHAITARAELVGEAAVRRVGTTRDFGSLDAKGAVVDPARIGLGTGNKARRCESQESQKDERAHGRLIVEGEIARAGEGCLCHRLLVDPQRNRIRKKQQPAGGAGGLL